jgi:hypothetical protein
MRPTDDNYDDGTVYLVVDPWPSDGPAQYISGEEALARELEGPFVPRLIIGIHKGDIEYVDNWYLVSLKKHISQARLSSVAAAVQAGYGNSEVWPERIYIHNGDGPINHDLLDLDERTFLEISDSGICTRIEERYGKRPSISRTDYRNMVESIAQKYGCHVSDIGYFTVDGSPIDDDQTPPSGYLLEGEDDVDPDYYADRVHVVDIRIEANNANSYAGRLIQCGCAISDYLTAIKVGGGFDAKTIVSLLRGGHVDLLIGNQEGAHLDVKSELYNIDAPRRTGDRQKIELAQDVARFANGDTDAVLVLGYAEQKSRGRSEVSRLSPVDLRRFNIEQYRSTLDSRIVPSITGLVIEQVEIEPDSGVVFIYIPRQPEEMQPYLVHGAIVEDKVEGEFFSIVQRRGEASINLTASQIHGYIVAGKAFLRRGQ